MQTDAIRILTVEILPLKERRILRAQWSPELAQDLEAYHSIDFEEELSKIIAEKIDKEIIKNLIKK